MRTIMEYYCIDSIINTTSTSSSSLSVVAYSLIKCVNTEIHLKSEQKYTMNDSITYDLSFRTARVVIGVFQVESNHIIQFIVLGPTNGPMLSNRLPTL